eukprot:snap_masked-scaffold_22-processed-gene-1.23-mRNA-1 protein AED:1.00 eAED:1.00 QI:0/0/0/0/1/1/2/0/67
MLWVYDDQHSVKKFWFINQLFTALVSNIHVIGEENKAEDPIQGHPQELRVRKPLVHLKYIRWASYPS